MALSDYTGAARNIQGGLASIGFVDTLPDRLKWLEDNGDFIDWAKSVNTGLGTSNAAFATVDGLEKGVAAWQSGAKASDVAKSIASGKGWIGGSSTIGEVAGKALPWIGLGLGGYDLLKHGPNIRNVSTLASGALALSGVAGPYAAIPAVAGFGLSALGVGKKKKPDVLNEIWEEGGDFVKQDDGSWRTGNLVYRPDTNKFYMPASAIGTPGRSDATDWVEMPIIRNPKSGALFVKVGTNSYWGLKGIQDQLESKGFKPLSDDIKTSSDNSSTLVNDPLDIKESSDSDSLELGDESETNSPPNSNLKDAIKSNSNVTISLSDYNKQWTEAPSITNNWIGTHVDGTREKVYPGIDPTTLKAPTSTVASTGVPSLSSIGGTGTMPTADNTGQPSLIEQMESALGIAPGSFAQYAALYNDELADSIKQLGVVSKQTIPFQGMNLIPKGAQGIALNRVAGLASLPNPNKYSADLTVRTALGNQDYQHNVNLAKLKHGYDLDLARIGMRSGSGGTDWAARQAYSDREFQHKLDYLDRQHKYDLETLAAQQTSQPRDSDDSGGSDFWGYVAAGGSVLDWLSQNPIIRGAYEWATGGGDDNAPNITTVPLPTESPSYDNSFMEDIDPYPEDIYSGIGSGWTDPNAGANPFEDVKPWLDYQPVYTPNYDYDFSYNGSGDESFWDF